MHSESGRKEAEDPFARYRERIAGLPVTRRLYTSRRANGIDAMVIDAFESYVVLDQTLDYPEGEVSPRIPMLIGRRIWSGGWSAENRGSGTAPYHRRSASPADRVRGNHRRGAEMVPHSAPHR